jgi:hypothetical protein
MRVQAATQMVDYKFCKSHPVLCSLLTLQTQDTLLEAALYWLNAYRPVMSCTHPHSLLRVLGSLSTQWDDMGLLLSLQDRALIFAGEPLPQNVEQSF